MKDPTVSPNWLPILTCVTIWWNQPSATSVNTNSTASILIGSIQLLEMEANQLIVQITRYSSKYDHYSPLPFFTRTKNATIETTWITPSFNMTDIFICIFLHSISVIPFNDGFVISTTFNRIWYRIIPIYFPILLNQCRWIVESRPLGISIPRTSCSMQKKKKEY